MRWLTLSCTQHGSVSSNGATLAWLVLVPYAFLAQPPRRLGNVVRFCTVWPAPCTNGTFCRRAWGLLYHNPTPYDAALPGLPQGSCILGSWHNTYPSASSIVLSYLPQCSFLRYACCVAHSCTTEHRIHYGSLVPPSQACE